MPAKRRRRRDDDDPDADLARLIRKRKKTGIPPGAILAFVLGGLVLLIPIAMFINRERALAPGPGDPDPSKLRLVHVAGNMFTFNSPAKIAEKFGPGRTLSRDEIERTILEERDLEGKVVSRKSVREWVRRDPATYTYYHWAIDREDLYAAFPNVPEYMKSSGAACWARSGKQWYITIGGDTVELKK